MNYICIECKEKYPLESHQWKCKCGGLLNLEFEKKTIDFTQTASSRNHSLWKYIDALPFLCHYWSWNDKRFRSSVY